jgi:hypothetical protein
MYNHLGFQVENIRFQSILQPNTFCVLDGVGVFVKQFGLNLADGKDLEHYFAPMITVSSW